MSDLPKVAESAVKPLLDQAVWTVAPSILGIAALAFVIFIFRKEARELFNALIFRLKSGAALKLASLEIGESSGIVATQGEFLNGETKLGVYKDPGEFQKERVEHYEQCRSVLLVHRLQRSNKPGQLYDILIYLIPHKASLAGVMKAEYFFGGFWGNKVFPSEDRSRGFPVVTSAYGSFLCLATIHFNDGQVTYISRYIDFEMGNCAPMSGNAS